MARDEARATGGMRGWVKVLLVLSLALNLLVLGLVAGAGWHHYQRGEGWHHGKRSHMPMGLRLYGRALERGDREALIAAARAEMGEAGAGRRELRAHFSGVVTVLRAEPFSPEALAEALAAQRATAGAYFARGHDLLVAHVAGMSPEARRVFADRLEGRLERYRRRH